MSPTVQDLKNEIRVAVGRFEREFDAQFTKEELAAIATDVGCAVADGSPPPKTELRAGIRRQVGLSETTNGAAEGSFVKAELETIADVLDATDR